MAELSLEMLVLKKRPSPTSTEARVLSNVSGGKGALVALVRSSSLPRRQVLAQLGLPKSAYYRWSRRREAARSLEDKKPGARVPWNKLRPEEERAVMALARDSQELSPRELALKITDAGAFSVSESTCHLPS